MGSVIQLKIKLIILIFNLKIQLIKLILVEEKIKSKLISNVELVQKMTNYQLDTGGKRLRALLTLGSAKMCGYKKGKRYKFGCLCRINHAATLMHDDVIDNGSIRGKKTLNKIWDNHSSVLVGDYLLSRCFEMMVEDGNIEVLKYYPQLPQKLHKEKFCNYNQVWSRYARRNISKNISKNCRIICSSNKVGAILSNVKNKKRGLEFLEEI